MKTFVYDGRWDKALRSPEVQAIREKILSAMAPLTFDETDHTYAWNGYPMISMSALLEERYENAFDDVRMSEHCSRRDMNNPEGKYYGKSPEEIRAEWKETADAALEEGHRKHAFAEEVYRYILDPSRHPEGITARDPGEEAILEIYGRFPAKFIPLLVETPVCVPELGYAGTLDLLLMDVEEKRLYMRDWKTTKDICKDSRGRTLRPPFIDLPDNPRSVYTLQLSGYRLAIEKVSDLPFGAAALYGIGGESSMPEVILVGYEGKRMENDLRMRPLKTAFPFGGIGSPATETEVAAEERKQEREDAIRAGEGKGKGAGEKSRRRYETPPRKRYVRGEGNHAEEKSGPKLR